jgi:hypothetical protein
VGKLKEMEVNWESISVGGEEEMTKGNRIVWKLCGVLCGVGCSNVDMKEPES